MILEKQMNIVKEEQEKGSNKNFPQMPERRAIFFIAISALIMSFSSLVPVVPILAFYALWFPLIYYRNVFILRLTPSLLPLGLLSFLCVYSTFWSYDPGKSIYYGLEFASMLVCVIIAMRIVPSKCFLKGMIIGTSVVLLINLLSNNYSTVYATGKPALVGVFDQKNTVGIIAAIGLVLSFLYFFYTESLKEKICFSILPMFTGAICLYLSLSKTSLLAALGTLSVLGGMYIVTKFPRWLRGFVIPLAIFGICTVALFIFAFEIDIYGFVLEKLEKDPTMTGRTWLWAQGIERALERPLTGYGYNAFWVRGQPDAELYWNVFDFEKEKGFSFHNIYIETFVQLGIVGLSIMIFFFISAFIKTFVSIIRHGMHLKTVLCLSIVTLFFIESLASVELLGPFGIQSFLFYFVFQTILEGDKKKPNLLHRPTPKN